MYPLVETMLIENGAVQNGEYHSARFNRSRRELFGVSADAAVEEFIDIPPGFRKGRVRCRLIYQREIIEVQFYEYTPQIIESFMLVADDEIDYTCKSTDRSAIDRLFAMRGDCDDVLIVKKGLITDASSSNVAFFNGSEWHTPAEPLLRGTRRAKLLDEGRIVTANISTDDLDRYSLCSPFNALRDLGVINVPVSCIKRLNFQ